MIATDEGFRAGAMLAHRARLSTSEAVKLVSEVNGTKSGARQAAMVKNIEATAYIDRIRELAGGITIKGPGRGRGPKPRLGMALGSLGALPERPDQPGVAVPGTRTASGGNAVSQRSRPDAGAGRRLDPETVSGAES